MGLGKEGKEERGRGVEKKSWKERKGRKGNEPAFSQRTGMWVTTSMGEISPAITQILDMGVRKGRESKKRGERRKGKKKKGERKKKKREKRKEKRERGKEKMKKKEESNKESMTFGRHLRERTVFRERQERQTLSRSCG